MCVIGGGVDRLGDTLRFERSHSFRFLVARIFACSNVRFALRKIARNFEKLSFWRPIFRPKSHHNFVRNFARKKNEIRLGLFFAPYCMNCHVHLCFNSPQTSLRSKPHPLPPESLLRRLPRAETINIFRLRLKGFKYFLTYLELIS